MPWCYIGHDIQHTDTKRFTPVYVDPEFPVYHTPQYHLKRHVSYWLLQWWLQRSKGCCTFISLIYAIDSSVKNFQVPGGAWSGSPLCQAMGDINLKDYFIQNVALIAHDEGLDLSGWEDAFMWLNISTLPTTTNYAYHWYNIFEWGGGQGAYRLANNGYKVMLFIFSVQYGFSSRLGSAQLFSNYTWSQHCRCCWWWTVGNRLGEVL